MRATIVRDYHNVNEALVTETIAAIVFGIIETLLETDFYNDFFKHKMS